MKTTLTRKVIAGLNIVAFLWVSTVVHAEGGSKDTDVKATRPQSEEPVSPSGEESHDKNPVVPPIAEAPGAPRERSFADEYCERIVFEGRDFCIGADSLKSRKELVKACKESYERNMTIAQREYSFAQKASGERQQAFEDFYKNLDKQQRQGKITRDERDDLEREFDRAANSNLTAGEHFRRCAEHARAAESQAVRLQQYHMAKTVRDRNPFRDQVGFTPQDRCTEYMDARIEEILGLDKDSRVAPFFKYSGDVEDSYDKAQEARELAEKCEGGHREAGGIKAWMSEHKGLLFAVGGLLVLAALCFLTPAMKFLSFCKQPKKPTQCKTCKGGGGGHRPRRPHHPGEPPIDPPSDPEDPKEAQGTFEARESNSDQRSGNGGADTFGDRAGGGNSVPSGASGNFGGRGQNNNGRTTSGGSGSFDRRDDSSNDGGGTSTFGGRSDGNVSR